MLNGCDMVLMNPKGAIGAEQKNANTHGYWPDAYHSYSGNHHGIYLCRALPRSQQKRYLSP
ncbi:hypothetical protein B738_04826 [Photorhabdus temperata subsp. temperata M1021]|nr:hypothetical protein B738_04826 [Photorhabdus temperata subsp. temperata M1021]